MIMARSKVKGITLRAMLALFVLGGFVAALTQATPALAQGPAVMEKAAPPPEEKKEEAPTTCGPMVSDTCIPLSAHKVSMQIWWAYSLYPGVFTKNWRTVSAGGDVSTFFMPVKFTYGVMENWETYVLVPFINNFISNANIPGPNGETSASFASVGDISWYNKYLLLAETDYRPAVTGVFGVGFPSGHASHLNPGRLATDAIGTGAFAFTTGVNLYKWFKPLLIYSNIWLTSPINLYTENGANGICQ